MSPDQDRDEQRLRRIEELVGNAYMARADLLKQLIDPRRNIDAECGYPEGSYINPEIYQQLYDREPIAARVTEVLPKESWQVQPLVYESDDPNEVTPFEEDWDALGKSLRGEKSHYRQEEGNPVWEYLRRVDELSGIGQYGVLLLGLNDETDLSKPVKGVEEEGSHPTQMDGPADMGQSQPNIMIRTNSDRPSRYRLTVNSSKTGGRKLIYLRCFPEYLAQITQFESNPSSPRYGQPVMYSITLNDPRVQSTGIGLNLATINVHWTRVIHVADLSHQASPSEVLAIPRMRPVLNRLLDLRKLYSGSAEMYWKGAFPGMVIETHPQLGGDVRVDREALRDSMEEYMNGLSRYLSLMGMSARTLAPVVADPASQIETHINAICIKLGCPKRVFMGSERGELASSQDDSAWNDRLKERQNSYITARIIIPFIDRLIMIGVLRTPDKAKPKLVESAGPLPPKLAGASKPPQSQGLEEEESDKQEQEPPRTPAESMDRMLKGELVPEGQEYEQGTEEDSQEEAPVGKEGFPKKPGDPTATEDDEDLPEGIELEDGEEVPESKGEGEDALAEMEGDSTEQPVKPGQKDKFGKPVPPGKPMPPGKAVPPGAKPPAAPAKPADVLKGMLEGASPEELQGQQVQEEYEEAPKGYVVEWPDITSQSDAEVASVAAQIIQAMTQYVSGGLQALMTPMDFYTRVLDFTEEEAKAILENVAAADKQLKQEEELQKTQQMLEQQEAIAKGLVPDPTDPEVIKAQQAGGMPPPGQPPFGKPGMPGQQPGGKPPFGKGGTPFSPGKRNGKPGFSLNSKRKGKR